ncbi:GntR family transcriptional regulator [Cryobacterium sp. Y57]|uniref:GntR family transcriptional regulator n=1 Tax=Cryobacterium sp. Y57 TaxID=2048287 RepID=UPI000CE30EC8|nr:GntR family transcriptional regulator [Cryobacterium sp. Y57]
MTVLIPEPDLTDVYGRILHKITSRDLSAGDRLTETSLADELNVSRTPVREALRRLSAEGYVDLSKNKGATVATFDEDLDQLFELRILLEGFTAGLASQAATVDEVRNLKEIQSRFESAIEEQGDDVRLRVSRINIEFHNAILTAAKNKRLENFVSSLTSASLLRSTFELYSLDQLRRSASQHQQLIDAIEHRDRSLAEMAMRVHISGAKYLFNRDLIA